MSQQFRNRPWTERFKQMGDEAEGVFETVATETLGIGFARYGLNRPPIDVAKLPAQLRYTPDYLTSRSLVEVQGSGRDQVVKLKQDKLYALMQWDGIFPTEIFLWDAHNGRWSFQQILNFDTSRADDAGFFDGAKPWFGWKVGFFDGWVPLDEN